MDNSQVCFKVAHHDVIRVLVFPAAPAPSWAAILTIIKERFNVPGSGIVLQYNDSDGDLISLSTDAELRENWPPAQSIFYVHAPADNLPTIVSGNEAAEYMPPETAEERAALVACLGRTVVEADDEMSRDFWSAVLEVVAFRVDEGTLANLGWHRNFAKSDVETTKAQVDALEDDDHREKLTEHAREIKSEVAGWYGKRCRGTVRFNDRLRGPSEAPRLLTCYECGGTHPVGIPCHVLDGSEYEGPTPVTVPVSECYLCGDTHPVNVDCHISHEEIERTAQRSTRSAGFPDSLCPVCRERHPGFDCPWMKYREDFGMKKLGIPSNAFDGGNHKNGPWSSRPYQPSPHHYAPPFPHRGVIGAAFVNGPLPYSTLPRPYHPTRNIYASQPHPRW